MLEGLDVAVVPTAHATAAQRAIAHDLFDLTYREADHAYLDASFEKLGYAAIAMVKGAPAGFALGEARIIDLPRLPQQFVRLAGMCCIAPAFRRQGLFGMLESQVLMRGATFSGERGLAVGRMAHPVSFRSMSSIPNAMPRPGHAPTEWQQEVGAAIAAVYGVTHFEPETFVCVGAGRPIGYPELDMEVDPSEWIVFEPVDRARGDSLLGMVWGPEPPPGW